MLAVTILCMLLPYSVLAQENAGVDIHEKPDGYTVVKSDPDAGEGELYTSTYQLQKFFEEEIGMIIFTIRWCNFCNLKIKLLYVTDS